MNEKPAIDWSRVPQNAPYFRERYESGYGQWSVTDEGSDKPLIVMVSFPLEELEAMGESERARLGVEAHYQFALAHQPPPPTE